MAQRFHVSALLSLVTMACGGHDEALLNESETDGSPGPATGDQGTWPEESNGPEEAIGQARQAIHNAWFTGPFHQSSTGSRYLESADSHVCLLTRVAGDFDLGSDGVEVYVDTMGTTTTSDDRWILSAKRGSGSGTFAAPTCFKKRATPCLSGPGGLPCVGTDGIVANGADRMVAEFSKGAYAGDTCDEQQTTTFLGDATTYLTGLFGGMMGGGEFARVDQSLAVGEQSRLLVKSCAVNRPCFACAGTPRGLVGFAHSFFAGIPRQKPARFIGSEHAVSTSGNRQVMMAEVHEAMCHFTRLQGGFQGGAELAEIAPVLDPLTNTNRWRLRVSKGSASDLVAASARCYARDQR